MKTLAAHAHTLGLTATLVLLAALPTLLGSYHLQLATTVLIYAIFAMSLDLLVGVTGLVSLGHAAFFGCAAYTLARLSPEFEAVSLWSSLPLAVLSATLAALAIGALALRTRGVYFIMVTLAFAQLGYYLVHDTPLGGGSDGVYLYFKPTLELFGRNWLDLEQGTSFYALCAAFALLVYLGLQRLLVSSFGATLGGIRVNEARMHSLGYDTFRYKLTAFAIAGGLAGLAGYLSACQYGFVNPEIMSWHTSGNVLMMVILGGKGRIWGAALGAAALVLLEEWLSDPGLVGALAEHWQLLLGLLIVSVVLFAPSGLAGLRWPWPRVATAGATGEAA